MTNIFDSIQAHLASAPNARVVIRTHYRQTVYSPKHATMFTAPKKESENGVYVQAGKRRDYVFPQYVHLASVR